MNPSYAINVNTISSRAPLMLSKPCCTLTTDTFVNPSGKPLQVAPVVLRPKVICIQIGGEVVMRMPQYSRQNLHAASVRSHGRGHGVPKAMQPDGWQLCLFQHFDMGFV